MDSTDDDWKNLKDTQYDPVSEPQGQQEYPSIKKGCLYFSAIAFALLFLFIKQLCIDDPPDSFKEFVRCSPDLLILLFFFPAGLAPLFMLFLPKGFELGAFLPIGWTIYITHGIALAYTKNHKIICTLLIILIILLIINVYGCVSMLKGI